jgi:hypothetical protein
MLLVIPVGGVDRWLEQLMEEEEAEVLKGRVAIKLKRPRSRTRDSGDAFREGKGIPLSGVVVDALLVI